MQTAQYDYSLLGAVGEDVFINADVEFRRPAMIAVGSHTNIDKGVIISTRAQIGDYVHIAPYVTIIGGGGGELVLENFATVAAGSRLICRSDEHLGAGLVGPTIPEKYQDTTKGTHIILRRFANVATNVIIYPDVEIAEGAVIAAGAVVTKSTEPWMIYRGTPAVPLKERPRDTILRYAQEMGY